MPADFRMSILLVILATWALANMLVCCLAWLSAYGLTRRQAIREAGRQSTHPSAPQSGDETAHGLPLPADVYRTSSAR